MQIRNIILYKNSDYEPRILSFKIGAVNIITGESSTGKTAIIDIVDYCLGSSNFNVKGSKIRDSVSWFAIIVKFGNEEVFIARENPTFSGKLSTNAICFSHSDNINVPTFNELINNSTISALNSFISNKLGINDNLHVSLNNTRDNLEATFKHSRLFSFQPQNVIAEFKYLFFNQDDNFVSMAIKDTLPYILGAIREDELLIQQNLTLKKKELNKLLRQKKVDESIYEQSIEQLKTLLEEARELDLISNDIDIKNDEDAIAVLNKVLEIDGTLQTISSENEQISKLLEKKRLLKTELSTIKNEIYAVRNFKDNTNTYKEQVFSQHDRLLSIGLYKEPTNKTFWNSILGEEVDSITPTIEAINNSLKSLLDGLQFTEQEKPKVQRILNELEIKRNDKIVEINNIETSIDHIYKENEELDKLKNLNIKKGKVIGRISLFFDSIKSIKKDSSLNEKITNLNNEIIELEATISQEEKENKINAILNKINIIMSSWSNLINWEYQNYNLRFDIKKLTIFADSDTKSESLQQMGSGENWLACHLLIHLALHKHFIEKKRPVPNFLILDQPTQVHYPKGYKETLNSKVESSDETADKRMFEFIFKVVSELSPNLQVIIMDHADFDEENFQNAIIEKWRNGQKLVPLEWINKD